MDKDIRNQLKPGVTVRVIQQIAGRDYSLNNETRGTVIAYGQQQTGSWFAHSKCDKLWLDRLTIKKLDGEIMTLNLDDNSVVEVTGGVPDESAGKQNETDLPV